MQAAIEPVSVPAASIENIYLRIPCPECAPRAPETKVAILKVGAMVDSRAFDLYPQARPAAQRHAAYLLIAQLEKRGYIRFREEPGDDPAFWGRAEMTATLGVVSPTEVATIEACVEEALTPLAQQIADEAIKQIDNWGSVYDRHQISKTTAAQLIREAVRTFFRERKRK